MWDAYQRFDHEKGEFSSYAYSYIKGRMMTKLTKHKQIEERNVYPDDVFWENTVEEEDNGWNKNTCKTTASDFPTNKNNG
ncbi:sigma factor [Lederbergia sp. NSJ-179]|uniref:sigma factor n=1 Tax=Lederbergia sp. NSJ-179 TaxID=2931402 RepID=UPI0037C0B3B2